MITALNNGGCLAIVIMVYVNLYTNKSGIYKHVKGKPLDGHSVRIVGCENENRVNYWIIANSWEGYWDKEGFFRMLRGSNECNIESETFPSGSWA